MRRRLRPAILWAALALAIPAAHGQEADDAPPERAPPDASFGGGPVEFGGGSSVRFGVGGLSLPPGFGVPVVAAGSRSGTPATLLLPSSSAGATQTFSILTQTPLEGDEMPPPRPPADASFGGGSISFGDGSITFSDGAVAFQASAIAAPSASTALAGMEVREENGSLRFTLGADVLFDFDKASLRPAAGPILKALVEEVRAKVPRARYMVEGHTDAKGSDTYNYKLSIRRAASVQGWLQRQGGVGKGGVAMAGLGESRPIAPNENPDGSDNPEGRQKNRRVEIVVTPLP